MKYAVSIIKQWLLGNPYWVCLLVLSAYLLVFQHQFVFSGDVWAEAFPEYVNDAVTLGWGDVFASGWAGYLTVLPAFIVKVYVSVGLPLGYVDLFLRAVTLFFTVICVSFIGHPSNRSIIKSDVLRIFIALLLLLSLRHVSALAFINIWYVGFIPMILVSLTDRRLTNRSNGLLTAFTVLLALSKSSLVLLPFVIYRGIKTRRYISPSLIACAVVLQTYLTVFSKNGYGDSDVQTSFPTVFGNLILSIGALLSKIIDFTPTNAAVVLSISLLFIVGTVSLIRRHSFWKITTLGAGLAMAIYLHIFAPDNTFNNLWTNYQALLNDDYKIQRELLINFLLLIVGGMVLSCLMRLTILRNRFMAVMGTIGFILLLVSVNPLRPIDTTQPGVNVSIGQYRSALNNGLSVCMPVPPTAAWDYNARWFYRYKGGCYTNAAPRPVDYASFQKTLKNGGVSIRIPATATDELKTVVVMLQKTVDQSHTVVLTDELSMRQISLLIPKNKERYTFISYNLQGIGSRPTGYNFRLSITEDSSDSDVRIGSFVGVNGPTAYGLFMGYPNLQ